MIVVAHNDYQNQVVTEHFTRVRIDFYGGYAIDKEYPLPSIYVYLQLNNDAYVRPTVTSEAALGSRTVRSSGLNK